MTPKVSVCIPAFEQPECFRRALESVREQTYTDYEVVVTDDSRDDSIARIVDKLGRPACIKYWRNRERKGSPENWNEAIRAARGAYVKLLHHDDWFADRDGLGEFVGLLDEHPQRCIRVQCVDRVWRRSVPPVRPSSHGRPSGRARSHAQSAGVCSTHKRRGEEAPWAGRDDHLSVRESGFVLASARKARVSGAEPVSEETSALRREVERQKQELRELAALLEVTATRETELRKMLLEAYRELERKAPRERADEAALRLRVAVATRLPALARLYRRARGRAA